MKRILAKHKHYKSLLDTFHNHPEFAEGKPIIEQYIDELVSNERRISEILSDIIRPVSFFYSVKRNAEKKLNADMLVYTSLGCMVASRNNNNTLYHIMSTYRMQLHKVSAYRLYLNAMHVAEMLQQVETSVAGPDFHTKKLPAFHKQAEEFGRKLDELKDQLLHRKVLRKELAVLIASTNILLHDVLDTAARGLQDTYPDFYREYMIVRHPKPRKRRTAKKSTTEVIPEIQVVPDRATAQSTDKVVHPIETEPVQPANTADASKEIGKNTDAVKEDSVPDEFIAQVTDLIFNRGAN
jgi:hypothetical protein